MGVPWVNTISYVADFVDYVKAADTNRPLLQLAQRTQYLYDQLQSASAGEALVARNLTLDSATVVGTPVYFDKVSSSWKPALAELVLTANDYGFPSAKAELRGIVVTKHTTTTGDIVLAGRINPLAYPVAWAGLIDGGVLLPGTLFLSAVNPGKYSYSRSVLSVYAGSIDSSGNLIFDPSINGNIRNHIHYRFVLESTIAGSLASPGWAAASDFSGAGFTVPAGATYGYNVAQNPTLASHFPPVPLENHYLEHVGRGVHKDAYVLDSQGLWWKDATYTPATLPGDANFGGGYTDYYVLWVAKLDVNTSFVGSISPSQDANVIPVQLRDAAGAQATSGNLFASIENSVIADATVDEGGTAVKAITGVKARSGPITSRVLPGDNVDIDGEFGNATDGYYGKLTVSAGTAGELTGVPTLTALDNAAEDFYGHLPALTLPEGRSSSIRVQVNVPTNIPTTRKLKLVLDFIGVSTQAGVSLGAAYTKISLGSAIPAADLVLANLTVNLTAQQVTRVETAKIDVAAGDTVFFKITQPLTAPTYSLPIIRLQYAISKT